MKISRSTITVLENFADINPSLYFREGNVIETISPTTTIRASANIDVSFPKSFAAYKLGKFLSTLALFNNPEITFNDTHLVISSDNKSARVMYSDESLVTKVSRKKIVLPSVDVSVTLTNEHLTQVMKALKVMDLPDILIVGKDGKIFITAFDVMNPNGDEHSICLGDTDRTFKAVFKSENIKLLPDVYQVEICSQGIARFKSERLEYFIAIESKYSTFA